MRRTNGELVAGWGNLVNRTASMIHKRFGEIPEPGELEAAGAAATVQTVAELSERLLHWNEA